MAAGQQKKRLNASNALSCNLQEQHKAKKKKKNSKLSQNVLTLNAHISLDWDDSRKKVFAKREQIGITWRDLAPFLDSVPHCNMGLADVFAIPQEFFGMGNVSRVLSYEIWATHLSETERNLLTQFLPRGADAEHVVQALLTGENFHFGNPFLKWGASLCSGNLHPDAILHQEQCFKANKNAYYSELQKYHNDILENLHRWKERWESCKDPGKETVQRMWRSSSKHPENSLSSHANESQQCDFEENLTTTAESCSWVADEKGCNSNKQRISIKKSGEPQKRRGNSLAVSERPKVMVNSRKEEKVHKLCIRSGNDAKYMSFFKISRKQHQLVSRIKQSGDGIQSKSLNRVLGDIKSFHVQPYETFEEEECKKLHEHWLQLARIDLPAAFAEWRGTQLQRQLWRKSLGQEMAEKKKPVVEEDEGNGHLGSALQEQRDNGETYHEPVLNIQNSEDDKQNVPPSMHNKPLSRIPSLNGYEEANTIGMDSEVGSQDVLKQEGTMPNLSEFMGNMNPREDAVEWEASISSAKNVWQSVGIQDSYYHATSLRHGYTSVCELSLRQPQPIEEQPRQLIDLKSDILEQESDKALLHRPSSDVGSALYIDDTRSFFSSHREQSRNEVLPPFLKGEDMLPSHSHEHKQLGLQFLATNDRSLETGQFSEHFREQQQQMLQQKQMSEKELYIQQIIQKNMYSNVGRCPIPSQELFSPIDVQDWPVDHVHVSATPQTPLNGAGLLGRNWFPGDQQAHDGWSSRDVSAFQGQSLGNGSNTEESLFSVLSQCSKLQSCSYDPTSAAGQYILARNLAVGGISGNVFPDTTHQLNYLGGHEAIAATATSALKANNISWINLPHQNSGLHDLIGKPFLRPWNQ